MAIDARGLREQLEEITDRYGDDRVAEQIPRIAELSAIFPHSISLLHAAIPGRPETFQFNCYASAPLFPPLPVNRAATY